MITDLRQHIQDRQIDLGKHRVFLNHKSMEATFPLWMSNQMVGYQIYRPNKFSKKFNDPKEGRYYSWTTTSRMCWGMESWNDSNTLFITEGIFDAARITKLGGSCLALLSCDVSKPMKQWLRFVRSIRPVIAICDNDENKSGLKLKKHAHEYHVVQSGGDLAEASEEEVEKLLQTYLT